MAQDPASLPLRPERRLHAPLTVEDRDTGESIPNDCIGGISRQEFEDEEYEQSSIQAFQVITQRKYMLTIYGCAVGDGNMTADRDAGNICLREEYFWMLPIYVLGLLYMFAGLAIICDEFFVPALELFTKELGLSDDVAGATFMAAGGSMPELFTAFIGTFNESDVGFAAIVGSAVFNVLFVIAVCTLASDEPLKLTWWPLFRDVCWYLLALTLVAVVFQGSSPGEIQTWEAALLFGTYLCYATFMKFNPQIEIFVKSKLLGQDPVTKIGGDDNNAETMLKPSTFRVGIFQLLTSGKGIGETAGIAAVTKVAGDLKATYDKFDTDSDGSLSENEVIQMLSDTTYFGTTDKAERDAISEQLKSIEPRKGDGSIAFEAFKKWYLASEMRVAIEMQRVFERFDTDKSGTIDRSEINEMLKELGHKPTEEDITASVEEMLATKPAASANKNKGDGTTTFEEFDKAHPGLVVVRPAPEKHVDANDANVQITFQQFDAWYSQSIFWHDHHEKHENEQEAEESGFEIFWPEGASGMQAAWFCFSYPIAAMMYVSMPDVRRKGSGTFRIAIIEFVCSLIWIAIFSLCLYDWLVTFCNTIGFPPNVAAVTVLAGGTSIPDLLSSYVVAKQGQGDMAVSSSIGSNIFDVTVGLPLPWLAYTLIYGRNVVVTSNSLFSSVLILILMLIGVIVTIMACGWKLSKPLGGVMMCLYVFFVLQQMLQDFGVINYGI